MNDLITTAGQSPVTNPQVALLGFTQGKLDEAQAQLAESTAALANAKAKKWNTKMLASIVTRARKQVEYLEKVRAAVDAGYVIMPAIPGDVFAVRIGERARLPVATARNPSQWRKPGTDLEEVHTDVPPAGEGKYVAPECTFSWYMRDVEKDGQIVKYREESGDDFIDAIPFPVAMAKPALMDATEEAMALKIFDDIAICPGRNVRKKDPIIYGRIHRPGRFREPLRFLICWLVRQEEI